MSPRKVRLVIDLIRGARATKAQTQLQFTNKAAAEPVLKLLNSAIANAVHNFQLNKEDLKIVSIMANEGPILDRWHPRAHGRAMPIRKRTTHLSIILEAEGAAASEAPKAAKKAVKAKKEESAEAETKPAPKKRVSKKAVTSKTE